MCPDSGIQNEDGSLSEEKKKEIKEAIIKLGGDLPAEDDTRPEIQVYFEAISRALANRIIKHLSKKI